MDWRGFILLIFHCSGTKFIGRLEGCIFKASFIFVRVAFQCWWYKIFTWFVWRLKVRRLYSCWFHFFSWGFLDVQWRLFHPNQFFGKHFQSSILHKLGLHVSHRHLNPERYQWIYQWQIWIIDKNIQRKNALMRDKDSRDLELFKKDFKYSFSLLGRVHIGLSQQNGMLIGWHFHLRESMFPQKLHIIPMLNNAMLYGVPQLEHTPFAAVDIIAHINFRLVAGTGDDDVVLGATDAG